MRPPPLACLAAALAVLLAGCGAGGPDAEEPYGPQGPRVEPGKAPAADAPVPGPCPTAPEPPAPSQPQRLVANAGGDVDAEPGDRVVLSGANSRHMDQGNLTYDWVQTAGPCVDLQGAATARPEFVVPPVAADQTALTFRLVVRSGDLVSPPDETDVFVRLA